MRRSKLPMVAFVMAVSTALALLGAAASLGDAQIDPPPVTEGKAVVGRFYDAVNAAIATGDLTALAAVVAAEFVEHEPVAGLPPDRAGLERYLATLHAVFPRLRLTAEAMTAEGDLVMARVTVRGADGGAFLGIPLADQAPPWSRGERFRVAGGQIVERWSDAGRLGLLEPLHQARLEVAVRERGVWHMPDEAHPEVVRPIKEEPPAAEPPEVRVVSALRVTHEIGGSRRWGEVSAQQLLVVESGMVRIFLDAASPLTARLTRAAADTVDPSWEPVAPGTEWTLAPGQALILPAGTTATTRNDERTPAVVLVVTVGLADQIGESWARPPAADATADVATQVLAGPDLTTLPGGLTTVAIGRATLAPGGELPTHKAMGPELIAVETGTLALATTGEEAWVVRGPSSTMEAEATLAAGDGALVHADSHTSLRNAGGDPLVLLVVTITPAIEEGAA